MHSLKRYNSMVGFSDSYRIGKSSAWSILEHFVPSKGNPEPTGSDPSLHLAHLFELIFKTKQGRDITNGRLAGHVSVLALIAGLPRDAEGADHRCKASISVRRVLIFLRVEDLAFNL